MWRDHPNLCWTKMLNINLNYKESTYCSNLLWSSQSQSDEISFGRRCWIFASITYLGYIWKQKFGKGSRFLYFDRVERFRPCVMISPKLVYLFSHIDLKTVLLFHNVLKRNICFHNVFKTFTGRSLFRKHHFNKNNMLHKKCSYTKWFWNHFPQFFWEITFLRSLVKYRYSTSCILDI